MNARSLTNLSGCAPALVTVATLAIRALNLQGMEVLIDSGLRTPAQQNAIYALGRTRPGQVVTNAKAGQSMHNYGLAFDCIPYITADDPTQLNWKSDTPQFQRMVAVFKSHGLEWGGDWKSFPDFDHFQLGGLPASPSERMLADYSANVLLKADYSEIWNNAALGVYGATTT